MRNFTNEFRKSKKSFSLGRYLSSKPSITQEKKNADSSTFLEDPVVMLQKMQKKMRQQSCLADSSQPREGVSKPFFFSGAKRKDEKNIFMEKVISLENSMDAASLSTANSFREKREQKRTEEIEKERSKLLVFRDVGMNLDKPILSRDVFLVWKYFRLGRQFAIDNELERMLRYFNEHAVNELKIIDHGKLMRGPETLFKARDISNINRIQSSNTSLGTTTNLSLKFPCVHCWNAAQFCPNPSLKTTENISQLFFTSKSSFRQFFSRRDPERADPVSFSPSLPQISISSDFFVRPAVVIVSQLGQKFGADADKAWRKLAFSTICPSVISSSNEEIHIKNNIESPKKEFSLSVDVISLRSSDLYSYKWVKKLFISRFLSSLSTEESIYNHYLAATTFVGSKLLHPFYERLGLRNFLSPYAFLVDGRGNVRWMSSGFPDSIEEMTFPSLLCQLASGQ